jgi:phospholipid/cholesterol/gamma-HCH transport system substrate-binding protein
MGVIGTVVVIALMYAVFNYQKLPFFNSGRHMSADFTEVGELADGDAVVISGASAGKVDSIRLSHGHVRVGFTVTASKVHLGDDSRALISTQTLLGKMALEITPAGTGNLGSGASIPLSRTTPPYDITSALSDLDQTTSSIDVSTLAKALTTVAGTFQATPAQLKAALSGVSKISQTVSAHDAALQELLAESKSVTAVVSARNAEVATLLGDGSQLLADLNAREDAITALFTDATSLASQLSALVKENTTLLKPALTQLDQVLDLLNRNKKNLQETILGLHTYASELGEAVSSGPFFDAYVENLTAPSSLLPVISTILDNGSSK